MTFCSLFGPNYWCEYLSVIYHNTIMFVSTPAFEPGEGDGRFLAPVTGNSMLSWEILLRKLKGRAVFRKRVINYFRMLQCSWVQF